MKKTLTINISGIIFHIDEDAFELLSNYLERIKNCFTKAEGCDEIIADIESRIAEMLHAKINEQKQVITIADIDEVITVMGKPEEIGSESGSDSRKENFAYHTTKRLFRDPENKVIGGVCSGIASYFNIDPVWIRIAFVAALFLFGSGPLLYLILWIVIPEAKTTAEKLEMKGEPININNIEKSITDEINHLKSRLKNLKNEAKDSYKKNFRNIKNSTASERLAGFLLMLLKYFIRFAAITIGVIFIILGIFLITGFITSLFRTDEMVWISSIGVSNISLSYLLKMILSGSGQISLAIIGLALFLGIPLLMLIYNGIKLVFGIKSKIKIVGISALSLWFAGLIVCIIITVNAFNAFSSSSTDPKTIELVQPKDGVLKVYVKKDNSIDSITSFESNFLLGQWNIVQSEDRNFSFGIPEIKIQKSENDQYQMSFVYFSKGSNKDEAQKYIKHINYDATSGDTAVILNPFYTLPENEKWRAQKIRIVIKVPLWKAIYFAPATSAFFKTEYDNNHYEESLAGKKWIMTTDGLQEYKFNLKVSGQDTLIIHKDTTKKK